MFRQSAISCDWQFRNRRLQFESPPLFCILEDAVSTYKMDVSFSDILSRSAESPPAEKG